MPTSESREAALRSALEAVTNDLEKACALLAEKTGETRWRTGVVSLLQARAALASGGRPRCGTCKGEGAINSGSCVCDSGGCTCDPYIDCPDCPAEATLAESLVYLWTRDAGIPAQDVVDYVTERMTRGVAITYSDSERIAEVRKALALPQTEAEKRAALQAPAPRKAER